MEEVTFANLHSRKFPQLNLLSELGSFKGDDWLNWGLNASPLNLRGAGNPPQFTSVSLNPLLKRLWLQKLRRQSQHISSSFPPQGRVPWNLAAAGLLPPDPGALAHPYPGYPAHPPVGSHPATSAYASPHLLPQVGEL